MDMRGTGEWRRDLWHFLVHNQRLLLLLGLFLGGVEIGCLLFRAAYAPLSDALRALLTPTVPKAGFSGLFHLMTVSCFPTVILLLALFLAGLSACGAPVALVIPLFFGMGLGLSEAFYFAQGGWGVGYVALLVLPHTLLAVVALLMGCAESIRMSALLCRQMLPRQGGCGGLWPSFKLYLARFLLCFGLAFIAGALDTVLRLCFSAYFV